ncbi:NAD-dependent epimerase/dehydratase family protein [Candidatus Pelagibacter sp. HIMB1695]|uniref:NAD-dependent epimerase/dehydratase family protein n=1 Tax=Candidatus Pelagibacter sp. HIMB1695 TaxID=3413364 RepID=UPI003F867530
MENYPNKTRIHITGATGFVGSFLANYFFKKFEISCSSYSKKFSPDNSIKQFIFDLSNKNNFPNDYLDNTDIVIHCAGVTNSGIFNSKKSKNLIFKKNILAAENIAKFAIKKSVKKFIFISTISVYDTNNFNSYINLNTKCKPRDYYGASKLKSEEIFQTLFSKKNIDLIILRVPLIVGPKSSGNLRKLKNYLAKGFPFFLPNIQNIRSYLSINSLAKLIEFCILSNEKINKVFLVSNLNGISTRSLINNITKGLKSKNKIINVHHRLLKLFFLLLNQINLYNRLYGNLIVDSKDTVNYFNWDNKELLDNSFYELGSSDDKKKS